MIIGIATILFFCFLIVRIGVSKAFLLFFIYSTIGSPWILYKIITVQHIIMAIFFAVFFVYRKKYPTKKYILFISSMLTIFSYSASTYFSEDPHWPYILSSKIFLNLAFPFLLFKFIKKKDDVAFFIKVLKFYIIFLVVYAVGELMIGKSVIIDLYNDNNAENNFDIMNLDDFQRFGFKRAQTLLYHPVTLGYFCVVILYFLYFFVQTKENVLKLKQPVFFIIVSSLSILVFLSGTRSAIIVLGFFFILLFFSSNKKIPYILLMGIIAIPIISYLPKNALSYFGELYTSIIGVFNSSYNSEGSSVEMRQEQLTIALDYFLPKMIWGSGYGTTYGTIVELEKNLYGAESVWFSLMIDEGIVGCLAYASFYVDSFRALKKAVKPSLIFLGIVLFMNSITTVPGLDVSFFLCLVIIIYKIQNLCLIDRFPK